MMTTVLTLSLAVLMLAAAVGVVDAAVPSLTYTKSPDTATHSALLFTITSTFNESVTGLSINDYICTNCNVQNFGGSGAVYTVDVVPTSATSVTLDTPAGSAASVSTSEGNLRQVSTWGYQAPVTPTVILSSSLSTHDETVFSVTATWSADLTADSFVIGDVDCTDCTVSNFVETTPDRVATFDVTPTSTASAVVDVAAGVVTSLATASDNLAGDKTWTYLLGPTATLTTARASQDDAQYAVTITFSAAVGSPNDGLTVDDLGCNGCTKDSLQETQAGTEYVLYVTDADGAGETTHTISLAKHKAFAVASGVGNQVASDLVLPFRPSATLSAADGVTTSTLHGGAHDSRAFTATATFSHSIEDGDLVVVDFVCSACTVSGVTKSSSTIYTFTVTPDGTADLSVYTVVDAADLLSDPSFKTDVSATFAVAFAPSVILTAPPGYHDSVTVISMTATWYPGVGTAGTAPDDFVSGEFTVSGCTAVADFTEATADTVFTQSCTPTSEADITIDVAAGAGSAGRGAEDVSNMAAARFTVEYKAPTTTLVATDGNTGTHDGVNPIAVQITFGAPVGQPNDFVVGDITLSGGTWVGGNITEATGVMINRIWTGSITPSSTSNIAVTVPGNVATGLLGGVGNTVSNTLTFVYKKQWGLVRIARVRGMSSYGGADATLTGVGTQTVKASLPAYKFRDWVEVCMQRVKDHSISSSAMFGYLWITVELNAGEGDIRAYVQNPSGTFGGEDPGDKTQSATLNFAASTIVSNQKFDLVWDNSTDQTQKCFKVGRNVGGDNWVTEGADACAPPDTFQLNFEAYAVEADSMCGGSMCTDNWRYFQHGLTNLVLQRTTPVAPPIRLLDTTETANLFDVSGAPPVTSLPVYSHDRPFKLLVLERTCQGDMAAAVTAPSALYSTVTTLNLTQTLDEVTGLGGLTVRTQARDLTARYNAMSSPKTWSKLLTDTVLYDQWAAASNTDTASWTGAACGDSEESGQRRFIVLRLSPDAADLANSMQSTVDFDGAVTSDSAESDCTTDDFTAPGDPVTLLLRNDPTRDSTTIEDGVNTAPVDLRSFFSEMTVSGTDLQLSVGQRLHLSTDTPTVLRALHVVGIGSCLPKTGSGWAFESSKLAPMCTNLPDTFESDLVVGPVAQNDLFDALFVTGAYQDAATDDLLYGTTTALTMTANPLYPWSSGGGSSNPLFQNGGEWRAEAYATDTPGELFNIRNGESIAGKFGARWDLAGTLDEYRACKAYDGTDVVDVDNSLSAGTTIFTIPVFSQFIAQRGTNPDDREWEELACVTKTYSVTFDADLVGTAWLETDEMDLRVDLLNVQAEPTTTCGYDATPSDDGDPYTTLDIDTTDHACDCGGSCPASAVTQRLRYTVLIDIERMANPDTGGDVGIRDTISDAALRFAPIPGSTCYGLETSSDFSNVQFIDDHAAAETYNRFILTAYTAPLQMYSVSQGANDPTTFTRCATTTNTDNFDFRVPLRKIEAAGVSWAAALADRATSASFADYGLLDVRVRFHFTKPLVASTLLGNDYGLSASTVELYLDPDVLTDNGASLESRTPLTASNGPVVFNSHDSIIVTHRLTHAATRDLFMLHIRDAIVCSITPASAFYDCLHPSGTKAGGTSVAGGTVAQLACPTGNDVWLQHSCDFLAWEEYVTPLLETNPVASSFGFVRHFSPLLGWGSDNPSATLCRYSVKTASVRDMLGTGPFFCENSALSKYECGADSSPYEAVKEVLFTPGGVGVLAAGSQWPKLSGLTTGGPFRGADAVEIPLAGLPTEALQNTALFVSLRSTMWDCGAAVSGRRLDEGDAFSAGANAVVQGQSSEFFLAGMILPGSGWGDGSTVLNDGSTNGTAGHDCSDTAASPGWAWAVLTQGEYIGVAVGLTCLLLCCGCYCYYYHCWRVGCVRSPQQATTDDAETRPLFIDVSHIQDQPRSQARDPGFSDDDDDDNNSLFAADAAELL